MGITLKIGLVFLVALLGFIIIFGNIVAPPKIVNFEKSSAVIQPPPKEPTRYINPAAHEPPENLTQNLASIIGKNIVDLNPQGPLEKKLTVAQAQIIAEKALGESIKKIDLSRFAPRIPLETITIAENSHYLASLAIILNEHMDALRHKQSTHSLQGDIDTALLVYQDSLTQLQQLPTPEKYTRQQQSIMSLIQGQINAFEALRDY